MRLESYYSFNIESEQVHNDEKWKNEWKYNLKIRTPALLQHILVHACHGV